MGTRRPRPTVNGSGAPSGAGAPSSSGPGLAVPLVPAVLPAFDHSWNPLCSMDSEMKRELSLVPEEHAATDDEQGTGPDALITTRPGLGTPPPKIAW